MACAKALGLDELGNIEEALMAGASEVDRSREGLREEGGLTQRAMGAIGGLEAGRNLTWCSPNLPMAMSAWEGCFQQFGGKFGPKHNCLKINFTGFIWTQPRNNQYPAHGLL